MGQLVGVTTPTQNSQLYVNQRVSGTKGPGICGRSTLKVNCSLKTGLRVFLWTLVSNFFFLSGSR